MTETRTAITVPAEQYIARAVYPTAKTNGRKWAAEFEALGGTQCSVIPSWRTGIEGACTVIVAGTPEAVAFVLDSVSA